MTRQAVLSKLGTALLSAQPFLTFTVFLSIFQGIPPLWLSWLITLIPWPIRFCITGRFTCRTPFDIPILISTAGMLLGFFLSPDLQLSLPVLNTYLACVLFYYGVVNNNRARLGYWVFITGFLCLILFCLSVWVFVGGTGKQVVFNKWAYELGSSLPSPLGLAPNSNTVGGAFAVVIPGLVAITLSRQRAWIRWSTGILAAVFAAILVLSVSGGGWIATMAGIFIVLLFRGAKTVWYTSLALGTTIGATFPIWHNTDWIGVVFPINSLLSRLELWKATIATLRDSPLTGLGLGGWWFKLPMYSPLGGPHNAYLQLYSDTGALGFIGFIIGAIVSVKLFLQILHSDKGNPYYGIASGIAAGIIAGGVHGLVDVNTNVLIDIGSTYLYFAVPLLWLWAALLVVSCQRLIQDTVKDDKQVLESVTRMGKRHE